MFLCMPVYLYVGLCLHVSVCIWSIIYWILCWGLPVKVNVNRYVDEKDRCLLFSYGFRCGANKWRLGFLFRLEILEINICIESGMHAWPDVGVSLEYRQHQPTFLYLYSAEETNHSAVYTTQLPSSVYAETRLLDSLNKSQRFSGVLEWRHINTRKNTTYTVCKHVCMTLYVCMNVMIWVNNRRLTCCSWQQ